MKRIHTYYTGNRVSSNFYGTFIILNGEIHARGYLLRNIFCDLSLSEMKTISNKNYYCKIELDGIPIQVGATDNGNFFIISDDGNVYQFGLREYAGGYGGKCRIDWAKVKLHQDKLRKFIKIEGLNNIIQIYIAHIFCP